MFVRLLPFARSPIELAEAEMAMGDERAHPQRLGQGYRLAVVLRRFLGSRLVSPRRDVAEQMEGGGLRIGPRLLGHGQGVACATGRYLGASGGQIGRASCRERV